MALTVKEGHLCGFCNTGNTEKCVRGTKYMGIQPHAKFPEGVVWVCRSANGERRCARCNNRNTPEIDPETWECFDIEGCHATISKRLDDDPFIQELREIKERVNMAKIQDNKAKTEKVAKAPKEPTYCVCCGEATKGGKFLPGHDARHVATLVEAVLSKNQTKAQAAKGLKDVGASDALQAKFDKSLTLATAKAEKAAAAEKDKKAAKAK